ncbi:TetR/AcrR family transcriptional regulator [Achromobacter anxifer]|uniref:TetR/AcrR family transcriptional regulator n=1 Tax=Achromobacter anxifer TaxID=1287737 RepID=UPI0023FA0EDA|nr:TetR/AcrR family transcriptional regulator [Achromobacter anxifer]MDF8365254.1 TetR/AcrR family transcriptional regulator [Achromobacter anxifer]
MTSLRGRPARGTGLSRDDIIATSLALLDERSGTGLTMRALASKLNVTPMSLYHHVEDRASLLRALADRVYGDVLQGKDTSSDHLPEVRRILLRYYDAVARHPQLTLAIFSEPRAFSGVTKEITAHLTALLSALSSTPEIWRDILIDHAHGSGLARISASGNKKETAALKSQYSQALDCLLARMAEV